MRDDVATVRCINTAGHLGEKIQSFHDVFNRRIVGNLLDSLAQELLGTCQQQRSLARGRVRTVPAEFCEKRADLEGHRSHLLG